MHFMYYKFLRTYGAATPNTHVTLFSKKFMCSCLISRCIYVCKMPGNAMPLFICLSKRWYISIIGATSCFLFHEIIILARSHACVRPTDPYLDSIIQPTSLSRGTALVALLLSD